jgi:hypothetical protein
MRGFHCGNSIHVCNALWTSSSSPYMSISLSLFHPFLCVWWVSLCCWRKEIKTPMYAQIFGFLLPIHLTKFSKIK